MKNGQKIIKKGEKPPKGSKGSETENFQSPGFYKNVLE